MSEENRQMFYSSVGYPPRGSSNNPGGGQQTIEETERIERMAGRMIEQAMTAVVVRMCWNCQRRFVKTTGCNQVVCVCGASTCHRCGGRMEVRHCCRLWLPYPNRASMRRAAWATKRYLRHRYPGLRFKYDPSRQISRQYRRHKWRMNRRNRLQTE